MKSWTTTGHLGAVSIRPDNTGGGNLLFRIRCTDPLQTVDIDYVALYQDGTNEIETLFVNNPYTFGFNTQMKNYLIATEGNHYTAMYALNGFSGTVNCKITDLSGTGVRDILVNRTFNSSNPITFGTPPSFTLNETGEYYIEFQATHNSAFALVPGNPHLAATFISIIQMARTVTLTARDQTMAYRYGFNTQMLDNNLAGMGNHLTAQYWEYDPRYGRRWNLDMASV